MEYFSYKVIYVLSVPCFYGVYFFLSESGIVIPAAFHCQLLLPPTKLIPTM